MARTITATVATFIVPGLGHALLGKVARGAIIGGVIMVVVRARLRDERPRYKPDPNEWLTWFFQLSERRNGAALSGLRPGRLGSSDHSWTGGEGHV